MFNLMAGISAENETLISILLGVDTAILALLLVCLLWWVIWRITHRKKSEYADENSTVEPDYTLVPKGMMLIPIGCDSNAVKAFSETVTAKEGVREADENAFVVTKPERKTIDENYAELGKEQKKFFDGLLSYALSKENAIENRTITEIQVKADRKQVVRIAIKRGITVAKFHLENDLVKQYRRSDAESKIYVKDTEIKIVDAASFETAKGLVDVAIENNKREIEAAAEARRRHRAEKRRAAKENQG